MMHKEFTELMGRWCIPRLVGSEGSHKIVKLLKQDFDRFNFECEEQEFPVFKSDTSFKLSRKLAIIGVLSSIFLILFWILFLYSLMILPGITIILATIKRKPKCSDVCEVRVQKRSNPKEEIALMQKNLIYRLRAKKERKCSVILVAHHDSKSQLYPTKARALIVLSTILLVISIGIISGICIILELINLASCPYLQTIIFSLGWISVVLIFLLASNRISNRSPGALDNASGLYTLWKTAKLVLDSPFDNAEIWFVLTGAEEIGQIGAAEFLNKYKNKLDPH